MVGASEERELNRLESQVDNGGGGAWEYLSLVRKLCARRSDKVLKHGLHILNDPRARSKIGVEEWTLYEQVAIASMDCQQLDIAKDCITTLSKKFPGSMRVGRLEGMLLEAKGAWADAEKAYARLLEDNPLDQVIHKRKVAMAKAQGNISAAVGFLNKYLEIFMADHDAWRELAEIYVSQQMYKQAAFCYEELILCQPTVPLYHLAYAEVLYTMGGLENLQTAKKYYASAINLTGGKNTRALYGVCLCSSAVGQLTKGRNKDEKDGSELQSLAAEALSKNYKQKAPEKDQASHDQPNKLSNNIKPEGKKKPLPRSSTPTQTRFLCSVPVLVGCTPLNTEIRYIMRTRCPKKDPVKRNTCLEYQNQEI